MNNIEKTKKLLADGKVAICNPAYLSKLPEHQEKSMIGNRTAFLAFHRFMFDLQNSQIEKIWQAYKSANLKAQQEFPNEKCCDLALMCDAIQYQIAVRDDKQGDPSIAEEIAVSFQQNARLAKDFDEVTSEYLIDLAKQWLN